MNCSDKGSAYHVRCEGETFVHMWCVSICVHAHFITVCMYQYYCSYYTCAILVSMLIVCEHASVFVISVSKFCVSS